MPGAARACGSLLRHRLSVWGAACSPADESAEATARDSCGRAAEAIEPADELRLLDEGLVTCESYEAFATELDQHPGLLGYSVETFIERRCAVTDRSDLARSPTCLTANPPTTPPPTTVVELVFVGTTLDGRLVEMRPTPEMPFVDDVPAEIQRTVDIAFTDGCEGLRAQRDRWAAAVDGSAVGRRGVGVRPARSERGDVHRMRHRHRSTSSIVTATTAGALSRLVVERVEVSAVEHQERR